MIWLASKSPRRQELLRQIGVDFELLLPQNPMAAEAIEVVRPHEAPSQYVQRVAMAKLDLARQHPRALAEPSRPILCADTTVAIGGRILGKPADADEAAQMLAALSGRTHRVLTAIAVLRGNKVRHRLQVSRVSFARLRQADIDAYVATGDCFDKAGAYGIQGQAALFVKRISGSYSGIMGLPLYDVQQLLRL